MPSLNNSNEILNALLQYSSDIVICLKNDFSVSVLNKRAEEFYKWKIKEVYGKNFLQLCKTHSYTCPIPTNFFDKPNLLNVNLDSINSSGKQCNINWVIYPLTATNDNFSSALIIGKDIELKKNNIAYYLNGIINSIPGCLYWKDCNGYYLGCNQLTAELAGLHSVYDVIGKTDKELWGEQSERIIENDQQVIARGETVLVQEELQVKDGSWMSFTGVKMPLRDENNNIIGLIGNALDITELKKTQAELKKAKEEAEALSRAKSEFIANMSHDVKTPLSGIIGLSEILLNIAQGKEFELTQSIMLAGKQLMSFFENCFEVARSEEADVTQLKEVFSLKILLEQINKLFEPAAKNKGLSFHINYDNKIPKLVFGSRASIYRIILNLVSNAIKFTHQGHIAIYAKLDSEPTTETTIIELTIEDTGIGIPKDKQRIIFERYTRLIPSYKGIYEGSGMGLYMVDKFIKAIHGEISVHSDEGKGSQFKLILPLEASTSKSRSKIPSRKKQKDQQPHKTINKIKSEKTLSNLSKVLLVEDTLLAQKVSQLILTPLCQNIDIADSGEKALSLFKAGKYDLVFLDIGLPDMSGYEISKRFREVEKTTPYHVPIIALTAHATDFVEGDCLKSGIDKTVSKPLSQKKAQQIINTYISKANINQKEL